jgi:hypothetical protein
LKYNAMSSTFKSIFEDFEKNKNFSNSDVVLTEMESLLIGNSNFRKQVLEAITVGQNDSMIPMPPIQRTQPEIPQNYQTTSESEDLTGGRIIGGLFFFGGIALTVISDGQAIFYGAIIYGLIKMATG